MNPDPTNEFGNQPFSAPAMDDADYARILDAACGYISLGLYAEAETELAHREIPICWRDRFESVRCHAAYAFGDMVKVIELGYERCLREAIQSPSDYILVAIALHNVGRWREAVVMNQRKIHHYGASPSDYYGIACYYGRAFQMGEALSNLAAGLGDHRNFLKALVDSDLQPFWTRLASLKHTPMILDALRAPSLRRLSRMRLRDTAGLTWDPRDDQALPAGFGRWIATAPGKLDRTLSDGAPAEMKRRLQQWILARAHANQHLLRQAVQAARLHRDYPWNDPKYAKYSTKKADRHSLSERAYHICYDQLYKLHKETTDAELRQEYHEELLDLTHGVMVTAMYEEEDEDDLPLKTR